MDWGEKMPDTQPTTGDRRLRGASATCSTTACATTAFSCTNAFSATAFSATFSTAAAPSITTSTSSSFTTAASFSVTTATVSFAGWSVLVSVGSSVGFLAFFCGHGSGGLLWRCAEAVRPPKGGVPRIR